MSTLKYFSVLVISGAMGNFEAAEKWTGSVWRCILTCRLCSFLSLWLAWVKNQQVIGPVDLWQNVRPVWISIEVWFEFQGKNLSLCWFILKKNWCGRPARTDPVKRQHGVGSPGHRPTGHKRRGGKENCVFMRSGEIVDLLPPCCHI